MLQSDGDKVGKKDLRRGDDVGPMSRLIDNVRRGKIDLL
jgi:hypothetical protein